MTTSPIAAPSPRMTRGTGVRMARAFRRAGGTALAVALLAGVAAPGMATADGGQDRQELHKAIQDIVDSGAAGVQLRVHDERGEWVGTAGVRKLGDAAKPPTDARFRIGSNTKTFVATVVLQLVAAGEIRLDSPAADYLPSIGVDRRITVRMLLQQTSGLLDFTGDTDADGKYQPGIPWQGAEWVDKRFHTYHKEELARLALAKPPKFEPGTAWSYSNSNYVLAALLIEKVTGHSYGKEMERRILRPLGLSGTEVPGTRTAITGPHTHGYYRYQDAGGWKVVDVTRQNPSWISAAGEMISTTADLHTFFSALQDGTLLPAPLLAEMRKPHPKSPGYGLGLFVQEGASPSPFPPLSCGVTVFTHNGGVKGYGALMYSTPDGKKTLTASLTSGDAAVDETAMFRAAQQRLVDEVFCGKDAG